MLNRETGEALDSRKLLTMPDDRKREEDTALMRDYVIETGELDMDVQEVIDRHHGLSRIGNQSEELKGPPETRPIDIRKEEQSARTF